MQKSQQNTCKHNPTTHLIHHTPCWCRFHCRDARMVQCIQINKGNTTHKQSQRQKSQDNLNR
jgi:hypothetical protein